MGCPGALVRVDGLPWCRSEILIRWVVACDLKAYRWVVGACVDCDRVGSDYEVLRGLYGDAYKKKALWDVKSP